MEPLTQSCVDDVLDLPPGLGVQNPAPQSAEGEGGVQEQGGGQDRRVRRAVQPEHPGTFLAELPHQEDRHQHHQPETEIQKQTMLVNNNTKQQTGVK